MSRTRVSLFATAAILAFSIAMIPSLSFAQGANDLAGVGTRLRTGLQTFPQIVAILAQIFGFFWALMAAMSLKKAGAEDDRNPQEMKKALFNLIAGVMAVGIPAAMGMGATTFFGGTDKVLDGTNPTISIK